MPVQKCYSTVELVDTIGGLIDRMEQKYGVELPLEVLFLWGTPAAPFDKIESAMNAGQDFIGKDLCEKWARAVGQFCWISKWSPWPAPRGPRSGSPS